MRRAAAPQCDNGKQKPQRLRVFLNQYTLPDDEHYERKTHTTQQHTQTDADVTHEAVYDDKKTHIRNFPASSV